LAIAKGGYRDLFESALKAFKHLNDDVIFPDVPVDCAHKVDIIVLVASGFTQNEAKSLIRGTKGTDSDETTIRNTAQLKSNALLSTCGNRLTRAVVLWINLYRLIERHSLSCSKTAQSRDGFVEIMESTPFLWTVKIDDLKLSNKVSNALIRAGYENVGELVELPDEELHAIANLGTTGVREIKAKIRELKVNQAGRFPSTITDSLGLDIAIENLQLSTRTYNALRRMGIDTVQKLKDLTEYELRDIPNFGEKSINEVKEILKTIQVSAIVETDGEENLSVLIGWVKHQFSQEALQIAALISDISQLYVSLHLQSPSSQNVNYKLILANAETLGDVLEALNNEIEKINTLQNVGVVALNLDSFQREVKTYKGLIETSFPNKETRDSLLEYENRYSDDSVDLMKFDGCTYYLLSQTEPINQLFTDKDTFFELIETLKNQFLTDTQVWSFIDRALEFHRTWGTFPNLIGLLIAQKLSSPDENEEVKKKLSGYFNSLDYPNSSRDLDMLCLRLEGETLDKIGIKYGLTRERVRQVLVKLAPGLDLVSRYLEEDENDKSIQEIEIKLANLFAQYGAIYKKELAKELSLTEEDAVRIVPRRYQKFIIDKNPEPSTFTTWTKEQVLKEIQKASTYYFPLRISDYEYLLQIGEIKGPSVPYIYNKFGTWREVCAEAGVEAAQAVRTEYLKLWSEEELLGYVRRFFEEPDLSSSIGSYDSWREKQPDHVPSGVLIRNVFGNWTTVKRKALERLRQEKGRELQ
jgi:Bacterial RNA polymerase, alpha chain C terminal domain